MSHLVTSEKKRQLWYLVVINFVASTVSLLFEIANQTVARDETCDTFSNDPWASLALVLMNRLLSLFVPLWSLLYIFANWQHVRLSITLPSPSLLSFPRPIPLLWS